MSAVLACGPGARLSARAAAALYGCIEWMERDIEVSVPGRAAPRRPGIHGHTTESFDARDVARHKGIPVTSPARTLVDLAAVLPEKQLRSAVRRAQSLRLVHIRQILETLDRLGPRRGSRKLRKIIATGPAPTRSELEDVILDLILGAGFAHPEVNEPLFIQSRRVIPDFRYAEQRLCIEADSRQWHENEIARADDAERQALLEAHGERVLRITWDQAVRRRSQTIARLAAAGAPRAETAISRLPAG
jgi:hypothetical protein